MLKTHKEDLVGQGECQLGGVSDGGTEATTAKKITKTVHPNRCWYDLRTTKYASD